MNDTITIESLKENIIKQYEFPRRDISVFAESLKNGTYRELIDGGTVIIDKGIPSVLMLDISNVSPDYIMETIRRFKAIKNFYDIRAAAAKRGWMTEEEIEEEIAAARRERRAREAEAKNAGSN